MTKQDLGGSLTARIEPRDGGTAVALDGNLTEAANLALLMTLPAPVRFDLSGVDRINSLGVRSWVQFVRDSEAAGRALSFERCSPVLVQQLSMISNFMGSQSRVTSMFVPYLCPSCSAEATHLVEVMVGVPLSVPFTIPCPKCKTAMQVDELEEMYASLNQKLSAR